MHIRTSNFLNARTVLLAVLLIGIGARVFSLALMPEEAYNDALFHLMETGKVISSETLTTADAELPPPLYYLIGSTVFLIATRSFDFPFVKFLPVLFALVQVLLSFIVLRKIFKNRFFIGLAFVAASPLLIRFGSSNYIDSVVTIFVLSSLFLLLHLRERQETNLFALVPLAVSIAALSITKLNGTIFVPVFFLAALYLLRKKQAAAKTIIAFAVLVILLSSVWFLLNMLRFSVFDPQFDIKLAGTTAIRNFNPETLLVNAHLYYFYLFDFPLIGSFTTLLSINDSILDSLLLLPMAAFGILVLPLFLSFIYGFWKMLKTDKFLATVIAAISALSVLLVVYRLFYLRFFMPMIPMMGICLAYGYREISSAGFRRFVLLSLLLFSLYSLAFTGFTAVYYQNVFQKHSGLYSAISALPEGSHILIQPTKTRSVEFYSGREASDYLDYNPEFFSLQNPSEVYRELKKFGHTHLAVTCYREQWSREVLDEMEGAGYIKKIYADECALLYKIN